MTAAQKVLAYITRMETMLASSPSLRAKTMGLPR